ncbi:MULTISPECIES: M24 family metallopeptidase [Gallibacterium]|uniref:Creatininase n=1 Tax=Gallibacterium genomosp. 3 TaxID=505345 RepID=A0A1A7NLF9_9PAST|nr:MULTISPECIES: M24 family metallopeptidase [Gallibacterium]MDA3978932.1 M24 family metallopeptidase [Gallibacterium sp. AGMB14963]OBW90952.1 creatininase [Gallibacterium genomosp. 3]
MNMQDVIEIRNGAKVKGTFSPQEMNRRLTSLRQVMKNKNLDAVILTSYHNVNYFSDYLYYSFGRSFALVVTEDRSVTVTANIDGGLGYRRSFGENIIYTDWRRNNFYRAIKAVLPQDKLRLGYEEDCLPLQSLNLLKEFFPGSEFFDVATDLMFNRMIKSAEEIELIKNGARIADIGGYACREAIAENVPEYEVAIASTDAMIREIAATYPHVELRDTWTWFQSGINTDGAHNAVTSRAIQLGDVLSLNCFPMIAGYYTALERTLFMDHCSDEQLKVWEVNTEVYRKGIELIKPGVRCCDIAHELNEIYAQYDLLQYRTFGYGHSFGVLSHYYGREAGLELREDIETVLQPGMVISMEPMLMIPEGLKGAGAYREHDILVVTEDGNQNITGFPVGPEHNIIKR